MIAPRMQRCQRTGEVSFVAVISFDRQVAALLLATAGAVFISKCLRSPDDFMKK
jgi:hypothetical protein